MKFPIYASAAAAVLMLGGTAAAEETSSKLPALKLTKIAAVETTTVPDNSVEVATPESKSSVAVDTASKPKKVVAPKSAPTTLVASINLSTQRLTVTEYGNVKYSWPISSGRSGYRTPTGTYRPKWMSRMHYSKKYNNSPMPHSVFFHRGYAIHATYATSRLGAPASHGCIRLAPSNARKFFNLVRKHKMASTRVKLHGVARDTKRSYARKKKKSPKYSGYKYSSFNQTLSFGPTNQRQGAYTWPGDRPRVQKRRRYRKRRHASGY